jgi:hypothetical protein
MTIHKLAKEELLQVGQHSRIPSFHTGKSVRQGVGQHPRMVGQHKTERWVNMDQNLQLEDYELQVCKFIGGEVTKNNLRECLSQINLSKNAWHVESLSELADVFKLYEYEISLKEVIRDLRAKLQNTTS